MEKIENYNHGKPYDGMECLATLDDINQENGNYCEYQTYPSMKWFPALFSSQVVQQLINTQFDKYMSAVQQPDCKAELRRLLKKGPPVWLEDKHALTIPDGDTHICSVWYASDNKKRSAKLEGAKEGLEREALWNELKKLLIDEEDEVEEKSLGDA